ncbi:MULTISPECIES: ankyrin repeat domain-containing protein [unclassified Endozoicomonas]|uniref:ankyrin repeat domain-containing protein n=1 Tax=unclassified Endozoicomonas TaxID=2644528 RepID=UPI003BB4AEE3
MSYLFGPLPWPKFSACGCQDPMPVVNQNTSESHPDTFFPDQTFYRACINGDLDQVERSLAEGVNVNAVMISGFTALMLASSKGHMDVVKRLLNW